MRACPFCAEQIQDEAKLCRFCQREVPAAGGVPAAAPQAVSPAIATSAPAKSGSGFRGARIIGGIAICLVFTSIAKTGPAAGIVLALALVAGAAFAILKNGYSPWTWGTYAVLALVGVACGIGARSDQADAEARRQREAAAAQAALEQRRAEGRALLAELPKLEADVAALEKYLAEGDVRAEPEYARLNEKGRAILAIPESERGAAGPFLLGMGRAQAVIRRARAEAAEATKRASEKAAREAEIAMTVTARAMFSDYSANEVAADEKYKGKTVRITGSIESIGKDILDDPYVTLRTGQMFGSVQAFFARSHRGSLGSLSKGQSLSIVCTVRGKLGNILVKGCTID